MGVRRELIALAVLVVVLVFTVRLLYDFTADTVTGWGTLDVYGRVIHALVMAVGLLSVVAQLAVAWLLLEDLDVVGTAVCRLLQLLNGTASTSEYYTILSEAFQLERALTDAILGSKRCRSEAVATLPVGRSLREFYSMMVCSTTKELDVLEGIVLHASKRGVTVGMLVRNLLFDRVEHQYPSSLLELVVNLRPDELAKISDVLADIGCDPLSDLELGVLAELGRLVGGMECRWLEVECETEPYMRRDLVFRTTVNRVTKLLATLRELTARVVLAS